MPRVDDHGLVKFLLQRLMQHAQPFLDGTKPLDLDASAAAFLSDQFRAARLQDSKLPEKAREFDESAFVRLKSKTDLQGIQREEFEHLLPLLAAVSWLRVTGAREKKSSPLLDFAMFPNARVVQFMNIGVRGIRNIGTLKKRVQKLTVSTPLVSSPRMLLAKDYGRGKPDDSPWEALRVLALRGCNITELDDSLSLLPQLEFLDCSDNQMTRISETEKLEKLRYANFSRNRLQDMRKLRMHFGMLSTLVLRGNSISSVDGLDQMYSLQALDLGANRLASFDEIRLLARLPCLQSLWLDGNPLASVPNFRRRTLKLLLQFAPDFADRAEEFILDGKKIESVDMTPPPDESSWAVRAMSFLFGDDDASPRPSTGGETPVRSVNTAVDGARRPVRRQSARRKPRTVVIKSAGDVAQQERRRLRKPALPDASESESDSDYSDHSDRAEPVISRHAVRRVRDRTDSFVVPEPTPVSAQRTLESDDDKDGQTGGHTDGQTGDGQTGGYTEGQTGYTDGVTGDHDTEHVEYGLEYSTAALWPVARSRALLRPLRVLSREELRHTVPFSRAERAALAAATFLQNERGQASASRRLQVAVYLCPTDAFERDEQKQKLAATDQRSVRLQGDVIKEVHPRSGHILRRFRMQQLVRVDMLRADTLVLTLTHGDRTEDHAYGKAGKHLLRSNDQTARASARLTPSLPPFRVAWRLRADTCEKLFAKLARLFRKSPFFVRKSDVLAPGALRERARLFAHLHLADPKDGTLIDTMNGERESMLESAVLAAMKAEEPVQLKAAPTTLTPKSTPKSTGSTAIDPNEISPNFAQFWRRWHTNELWALDDCLKDTSKIFAVDCALPEITRGGPRSLQKCQERRVVVCFDFAQRVILVLDDKLKSQVRCVEKMADVSCVTLGMALQYVVVTVGQSKRLLVTRCDRRTQQLCDAFSHCLDGLVGSVKIENDDRDTLDDLSCQVVFAESSQAFAMLHETRCARNFERRQQQRLQFAEAIATRAVPVSEHDVDDDMRDFAESIAGQQTSTTAAPLARTLYIANNGIFLLEDRLPILVRWRNSNQRLPMRFVVRDSMPLDAFRSLELHDDKVTVTLNFVVGTHDVYRWQLEIHDGTSKQELRRFFAALSQRQAAA